MKSERVSLSNYVTERPRVILGKSIFRGDSGPTATACTLVAWPTVAPGTAKRRPGLPMPRLGLVLDGWKLDRKAYLETLAMTGSLYNVPEDNWKVVNQRENPHLSDQ